jgi:DNA-binding beta-propeller fold protein YncE
VKQAFACEAIWAIALLCWCPRAATAQSAPLKLKQTIELPGVEGRIDHLGFDGSNQRLFVCALGNNSVEVIDARKGQRIHSITGLGSPQGLAYIPPGDRVLVANDRGGMCRIYDCKSFQQLSEIDLKDDADNARYDDHTKQVYVGFGTGGIAIINALDGKQAGSIKLSAHPEAFQVEKNGNRIFVNIPGARCVAVIDRIKGAVVARWKTDLASANFPMASDEANHRLFVGCRVPPKVIVLDTGSGEVSAELNISGDVDDVFYDGSRHRVYAICGAGKIHVIQQSDANTYVSLAEVDTEKGARTGLFVPEQDTLFVAVPKCGTRPAEVRAYHVE